MSAWSRHLYRNPCDGLRRRFRLGARLGFGLRFGRLDRLLLHTHQHVFVEAILQHDVRRTARVDFRGDLRVPLLRRGHHDAFARRAAWRPIAANRASPAPDSNPYRICPRFAARTHSPRRAPRPVAAFLPSSRLPHSQIRASLRRSIGQAATSRFLDEQQDSRRAIVVAHALRTMCQRPRQSGSCEFRSTVLRSD